MSFSFGACCPWLSRRCSSCQISLLLSLFSMFDVQADCVVMVAVVWCVASFCCSVDCGLWVARSVAVFSVAFAVAETNLFFFALCFFSN